MKFIDLHIHSPYSQAVSQTMLPEAILQECRKKGLDIIGTGDILIPEWEAKWKVVMDRYDDVEVIPAVEISSVDKNKYCHILLVIPWEYVSKTRKELKDWGDISSNGRPNIFLNLFDLKNLIKSISEDILFIPAHCLTPWFGIMGHRYSWTPEQVLQLSPDALETGLSASREMIWSISSLHSIPLVSFSDAHSLSNIAREVTIIPDTLTLWKALKKHSPQQQAYITLEYIPELGKYYLNGHRNCSSYSATDTVCSVCGKHYTVGVSHTVSQYKDTVSPFNDIFTAPLSTILKLSGIKFSTSTKELHILLGLETTDSEHLNSILVKIRNKYIALQGGYDGKYGKIEL